MKKSLALLVLLLALAAVAVFLPYRAWLEQRLEHILEAKGFEDVELTISSVGLDSASLENVSVGGENRLKLKNIVLEYSPRELWSGYLRDLSVNGVTIDVRENENRWVVTGLENWGAKPKGDASKPFAIPVTPEQFARIPFERIQLEDSLLNVTFGSGKLSLPLDLTWQKSPQSLLTYKSDNPALTFSALEMTAESLTLDAHMNDRGDEWTGAWKLKTVTVGGTAVPVPVMNGEGSVSADNTRAEAKGKLLSDDKLWEADFTMNYDFAAPGQSALTVLHATMPWKEGRIDVRNVKIPLAGQNPIKMTLHIQSVSLQELMGALTGDRIAATGNVSGTLPLIIARDGKVTILPGDLKSEGPGTISMPPDAIPGTNEQVALVRQILEDLQYTALSIAVKNDESGRLGVLMTFEGNNPDVYEGRPVKLNVNLTGDILEFVQQNILLLTKPEQLLEQGNDEQN